jgi:lysophospholipase L1-like esterase
MKRVISAVLLFALLFSTAALAAPKSAPRNLKIKVSGRTALVSWKKVRGAKRYQIKYAYKKNFKYAKSKTVKKTKTTLKSLKTGKTLYVKVRARVGKKYRRYSAVKSAKIRAKKRSAAQKATTAAIQAAVVTNPAPTAPQPTKKPLPANLDTSKKTFSLNDAKSVSRIIGRAVWNPRGVAAEWSGAGFETGLICKGEISLKFNAEGKCGLLGVVINEQYDKMQHIRFTAGENEKVIASGLPADYYTVRVVKLNEYDVNGVEFESLTVEGVLGDRPQEKRLKIEVIGDSLSAGYGNLYPGTSGMDESLFGYYEDAYQTYTAFAAQKLNADLNIVAKSGFGIMYDCNGGSGTLPPLWKKDLPRSGTDNWDFSSYIPDIVVINLGSNDTSQTNYIGKDAARQAVFDFTGEIRAKYPNCKIVWIEGQAGSYNINLSRALSAAQQEIADFKYIYMLSYSRGGYNSHPTAEDNRKSGDELIGYLKEFGWVD